MSDKPVPPADPVSMPYWLGTEAGALRLQHCPRCDYVQFPPRIACTACASRDLAWQDASGRGTVRTFTIIRRAVSAAFEADVPYVVALIALDEGPTMMTNIVGCTPETVAIGQRVRVMFERRGDVVIPQFIPA